MNWLRKWLAFGRGGFDAIAEHDASSWIGHLLVAVVIAAAGAHYGSIELGRELAGWVLAYYANREGLNWGMAKLQGKADRRKLVDGLLDFAGPAAVYVLMWHI